MTGNKKHFIDYKVYSNDFTSEWVVFFHGLGGNHTIFNRQIDAFKNDFNLLLIDLPGHGNSTNPEKNGDALSSTGEMVIELLDNLNIKSAHFVGLSLGTIVMQHIAGNYPDRIKSMVLAGAVGKWLRWGDLLGKLTLSFLFRNVLPYMFPYVVFAHILMPRKNHKKSRQVFIKEARNLDQESYLSWAFVSRDTEKIYENLSRNVNGIPKLYVSGEEDYMFLQGIKDHVKREKYAELYVIKECGHVCTIEKSAEFNLVAVDFIKEVSKTSQIV